MAIISTENLIKCINTLEKSYNLLINSQIDSIEAEIYRNSTIKGFELTLEQSGKLLKKKLKPFFATNHLADNLIFKDIFRYACKHNLLTEDAVLRWHKYRDNRNNTTHDYGKKFAEETVILLQDFIKDAKQLLTIIETPYNNE